ncbi:fungal-specific transcription factor domain-containing protein [Achaetomium macrosporum]|uniref:Fungal-specific transcription factor domain-containing protein n=1 Tax=Achaetomium macrosporum TaxID=79813 RepID=A0AAN7C567_9PEZI|nr:fungal-specific transcription factor domain-containing protein [Achaetomium macrosporum]
MASAAPGTAAVPVSKLHKVSRACDLCKAKKARCSGTLPCASCSARGLRCVYDTKYSRGRPPTPPPAESASILRAEIDVPSRASPEVDMAEIEGQYFDPSSGLSFLHRAINKLATTQKRGLAPHDVRGPEDHQPLMRAGDRPFVGGDGAGVPERHTALELLAFYFDVCVVTYRIFHRPTAASWLDTMLLNTEQGLPLHHGIGHGKASIILTILAISTLRKDKVQMTGSSVSNETDLLGKSDQYFVAAAKLTEAETGLPRLESAQARLIQVLYLLQTSRMNQAWYVFGTTSQIISALGLHRRAGRKRHKPSRQWSRSDYIHAQCRKRTFWAAYIIDKYLSVVFGRPMQHRDEDIDQEFPDSVNDEDMTPQGPSGGEAQDDCHLDAMIFHAKIARIIGRISRDVYTIKPIATRERVAAAHRASRQLHEWREALPSHLGTVRPSSLIPSFRRQAIALKLAYSHAIMHANRPFLLGQQRSVFTCPEEEEEGNEPSAAISDSVTECISAARVALETIDSMASDGTLFHAFWWTSYVTFCALAVGYVWEIQRGSSSGCASDANDRQYAVGLAELAERCRSRLDRGTSTDSPNRRYSVVLEELRLEARRRSCPAAAASSDNASQHGPRNRADADIIGGLPKHNTPRNAGEAPPPPPRCQQEQQPDSSYAAVNDPLLDQVGFAGSTVAGSGFYAVQNMLDGWQPTDWLDLDSSAFGIFAQTYESPEFWDIT